MRARGFALRDKFADVLNGIYLTEEIEESTGAAKHSNVKNINTDAAMEEKPVFIKPQVVAIEEAKPEAEAKEIEDAPAEEVKVEVVEGSNLL